MQKKYKNLYNSVNEFITKQEQRSDKPLYELGADGARKFLEDIQKETYKEIKADISDTQIATELAGNIELRFIRPLNALHQKLPLIIYVHGGGWIMGSEITHDMLVRKLCINTNSCAAFIKYTHSPEAAFPLPFNQVYAAVDFLYKNHEVYNINPEKIILAGDSAGAGMAAAAAVRAKEENGAKIIFQLLLYPALDINMNTSSYTEFENGPWLTKKSMEWFWKSYLQNENYYDNIYAVPMAAKDENLKGLPPALIITAENDVLRDEGEKYAIKLDNAGVEVKCARISGTCHDFMMLNALSETSPTVLAFETVNAVLNKILQ